MQLKCKTIPVCPRVLTETSCGLPPNIQFADLTTLQKSEYKSGVTVEYKCQHFYTLIGSPFMTCAHGQWNGLLKCLGKYTNNAYGQHSGF